MTTRSYRRGFRVACALSVLGGFGLQGCTHQTLIVKGQTPADELPGIPFYTKQGVCKKESDWLEPQYTLVLGVAIDGGPPTTHTLALSRQGYVDAGTQTLVQMIQGLKGPYPAHEVAPNACPAAIGRQWESVAANPVFKIELALDLNGRLQNAETQGNVILVKNRAKIGTQVDYTKRYYLNARSPWVGSSQVDAKLADDGTLTEGSAQRDDETWNTILTTISSLVGDFTGAAAATAPAAAAPAPTQPPGTITESVTLPVCSSVPGWPEPKRTVRYTYSLKTVIYRHHHESTSTDLQNACSMNEGRVYGGNFTVTEEDASGKDKKSNKAIEFSGSITLPDDSKGSKKGSDSEDTPKQ
jgi:hypothetical protein